MTDIERSVPGDGSATSPRRGSPLEVFLVALRLGLTSFGGPVAHLGYFQDEYVERRRWLDEATFSELLALTNVLPGPTSSQLGIAIGTLRAGLLGGIAAWIGFTAPSAMLLILFAYGIAEFDVLDSGWLHGLKIAAVAVVANALWGMAKTLAPDRERATLALAAAVTLLVAARAEVQIVIILVGGVIGWRLFGSHGGVAATSPPPARARHERFALALLVIFFAVLIASPIVRGLADSQWVNVFDVFYRVGSLVFGGGHVVLPLLEAEVVQPGWVTADQFTAGYGAAQAVPGPLFTFAAFLGAAAGPGPNGWVGGLAALVAIFLPSFLLVWGALPFWNRLRAHTGAQAALRGIGAVVVGILLAALYDPVWTSAIFAPADVALALTAFGLLAVWRLPPWVVVGVCAAGGQLLASA